MDDIRCPEFSPLIAGNDGKLVGYLAYAQCHYPVLLLRLAIEAEYSMPQVSDLRCVFPLVPNRLARSGNPLYSVVATPIVSPCFA
jgi:hypothetical protein